jgi:hypothetical protein
MHELKRALEVTLRERVEHPLDRFDVPAAF